MSDIFEVAKATCITCINSDSVTDEYLKDIVNQVTSMPLFNTVDKDLLFEELSTMYSIRVEQYRILEDKERRKPWLKEFKANHKQDYWMRKHYLIELIRIGFCYARKCLKGVYVSRFSELHLIRTSMRIFFFSN